MSFRPGNLSAWRWCGFMLMSVLGLALAGCASGSGGPSWGAETQIRERIASIREAILAKSAAGILRWSTEDWTFAPADGTVYDRAAYLKRTEALFTRIDQVESLETTIDHITIRDEVAEVVIMQTMIRRERPAAGGKSLRVWLQYREQQMWVRVAAGDWRVRRVQFIDPPDRRELGD